MACDGHEVSAAFEEEVDVVWRAVEHLLLAEWAGDQMLARRALGAQPPPGDRRCLLATVDMTVLVGSDGHRATIQFGDPATSH